MAGDQGAIAPTQISACWNIFFVFEFFSQKYNILRLKIPILGQYWANFKFRAAQISSVGNLQLSVGKLQLPAHSSYFLNP